MFWTICLYCCYAIGLLLVYWLLKTYKTMYLKFGSSTGVQWCRFLPQITDSFRIIKEVADDPYRIPIYPALKTYFGKDVPAVTGMWLFGTPTLVFNKVAALDDIYVKKNKYHTKHENERLYG